MDQNYLLPNAIAKELYFSTAADLPLIDYHNHLSVKDLAEDRQYSDIAEAWLLNDPYKHRAMRICSVDEALITGNAPRKEKFAAWCSVYPRLIGNPLYDWSALEIKKLFGIETPICRENAEKLWDEANEKLQEKAFHARGIYHHFNIRYAAPCATIGEDLTPFSSVAGLAPSLRGDDLLTLSAGFIDSLSAAAGIPITDFDSLKQAVTIRLEEFQKANCRFSDHAIDNGFTYRRDDGKNPDRIASLLAGSTPGPADRAHIASAMLRFLADQYAARGWTMQLHIGAQRSTSTRLRRVAGPAGGFAAIGSPVSVLTLTEMLDDFEQNDAGLPHIILFTLNPVDNAVFAVLSGSFPGVTQGPAWWWCDHLHGMREMLETFSSYSILSTFVGMTTDSRSLLSLLRHDYFRRMLCGWIGEKADAGEFPREPAALKNLVTELCYSNAEKLIH